MSDKREELGQLFENNSNCYADTREECDDTIPPTMVEGEVILAMDKEQFIEVVTPLQAENKQLRETLTLLDKTLTEDGAIGITSYHHRLINQALKEPKG